MNNLDKKRTIGEVANELDVEPHVIRFWETKFPQIKPNIGQNGRRYYYDKQISLLKKIKRFLYEDRYTIEGLQKLLRQRKKAPNWEVNSFEDNIEENNDQIGSDVVNEVDELANEADLDDEFANYQNKIVQQNLHTKNIVIDKGDTLLSYSAITIPSVAPDVARKLRTSIVKIRHNCAELKILFDE